RAIEANLPILGGHGRHRSGEGRLEAAAPALGEDVVGRDRVQAAVSGIGGGGDAGSAPVAVEREAARAQELPRAGDGLGAAGPPWQRAVPIDGGHGEGRQQRRGNDQAGGPILAAHRRVRRQRLGLPRPGGAFGERRRAASGGVRHSRLRGEASVPPVGPDRRQQRRQRQERGGGAAPQQVGVMRAQQQHGGVERI